jgi:hypothetical protein
VAGVVALTAWGVLSMAGPVGAQSLPSCGGQNAAPRPVPYTCTTDTRLIDGSQVFAIVSADGQTLAVTFHLLAPRSTDATIRIVHHIGTSGAGGSRAEASGLIPAGQTQATLMVATPCFAGQVDIKFVFTLDSQPQGRVGGPWITNGTGCTPTSTTSTTTTATTPPTSTPQSGPIFVSAVGTTCQKDVPVIVIRMGNRTDLNGRLAALTFIDLNGKTIQVRTRTYKAGGTLTELYPGASVDANGNATDWPGWKLNQFGFWVEDPTDALWRQGLTLRIDVNPTASTQISYPPASSACANPDSPPPPSGSAATLPATGGNTRGAYSLALVAVVLGSLLVVIAGTRRVAARRGDD